MTTAVIYTRISKDSTGSGAGVARQKADAEQLAAQRGWDVLEVIAENSISAGGRQARPGFARVLELVEAGQVTVIIAWTLDRLTRNRRDTVRLIEACQRAGATIALVRGTDLDMATPAGRLTADLLAAVARSEIDTTSDRYQRAALQLAEQGRHHGGRRPFGYEADGVTLRESEARAVRDGIQWVLEGVSYAEIARRWNAAGVWSAQPGRDGERHPWKPVGVRQVLDKPRYAGLRVHRGEIIGPACWPAIVDEDTWRAARAVMNDPGRRHARPSSHLLSGIAVCAVCESPVVAGTNHDGPAYRCPSMRHVIRTVVDVDAWVEAAVVARLRQPDASQLCIPPQDTSRYDELLAEAAGLRSRADQLAEAYAAGQVSISQLTTATGRIRADLEVVERRIATAQPVLGHARALVAAGDVPGQWEQLPVADRRAIIELLATIEILPVGQGRKAVAGPDTIRLTFRNNTKASAGDVPVREPLRQVDELVRA